MKHFVSFLLLGIVLSLACVIGADHLVDSDNVRRAETLAEHLYACGPNEHHALWEWLTIAAWVFGLLPIVTFIVANCCEP